VSMARIRSSHGNRRLGGLSGNRAGFGGGRADGGAADGGPGLGSAPVVATVHCTLSPIHLMASRLGLPVCAVCRLISSWSEGPLLRWQHWAGGSGCSRAIGRQTRRTHYPDT
jgi:hypothetical protein